VTLVLSATLTQFFKDERVIAAYAWNPPQAREIEIYEEAMKRTDEQRFCLPYPPPENLPVRIFPVLSKAEKSKKLREEDLKQRAEQWHKSQLKKVKILVNSPEHPLENRVCEIISANDAARRQHLLALSRKLTSSHLDKRIEWELHACFFHLRNVRMREALELVIWGRVLTLTLEEVEFFNQEIVRISNEAMKGEESKAEQDDSFCGNEGTNAIDTSEGRPLHTVNRNVLQFSNVPQQHNCPEQTTQTRIDIGTPATPVPSDACDTSDQDASPLTEGNRTHEAIDTEAPPRIKIYRRYVRPLESLLASSRELNRF
jgi:hypothetical protein